MLSTLGVYMLTECLMCVSVALMMLPVVVLFGGEHVHCFAAALLPSQVIAVNTRPSLASLPAMLENADRKLSYPASVIALVLPTVVSHHYLRHWSMQV